MYELSRKICFYIGIPFKIIGGLVIGVGSIILLLGQVLEDLTIHEEYEEKKLWIGWPYLRKFNNKKGDKTTLLGEY